MAIKILTGDLYNDTVRALDKKYFPNLKYYRDDDKCAQVHYQTELFNNGCITLGTFIKRVAKLCKDTEENVEAIVMQFVEIVPDSQ